MKVTSLARFVVGQHEYSGYRIIMMGGHGLKPAVLQHHVRMYFTRTVALVTTSTPQAQGYT